MLFWHFQPIKPSDLSSERKGEKRNAYISCPLPLVFLRGKKISCPLVPQTTDIVLQATSSQSMQIVSFLSFFSALYSSPLERTMQKGGKKREIL